MVWIVKNPRCGVYRIDCDANGKYYIGSSTNIKIRLSQHKTDLRGDYHDNRHLQAAWNKYGAESFRFQILEEVPEEELIDREQHWIDTLDAANHEVGFNLTKIAGKSFARGMVFSPETIENLRGLSSRSYVVTDPEGNEQTLTNLKAFCEERGLCLTAMRHVSGGDKVAHHMGWMVRRAEMDRAEWIRKVVANSNGLVRYYQAMDSEGNVYGFPKLKHFCLERGIDYPAAVRSMKKNRILDGWYFVEIIKDLSAELADGEVREPVPACEV